MRLTSSAFNDDSKIPCKYTCDGDNMSPPLIISDVPPEAESLVLIMEEPQPPKGASPIDHWLVFDTPPGEQYVPEGEAPERDFFLTPSCVQACIVSRSLLRRAIDGDRD